jgi:1-pyrroline-5-carboxylate dehydrogenase
MLSLSPFQNEPYLDFTQPKNRAAMEQAMQKVRGELGREYSLLIGGERVTTGSLLNSLNPSKPQEIIGAHHKATPELARQAVEDAYAYFAEWGATDPADRVRMLVRAADLLRQRKLEFNAWLAFEAGKTWPEAEAETAEAIDFCEYYARQMLRFLPGDAPVQMPGEKDEVRYLPLGVGIIIPPWNFSLAILCGMAVAALVTGNTVIIKP